MASGSPKTISILPDLREAERQQTIAAFAFDLWLARDFRRGSPARDWLRAQRKVMGKAGSPKLRRTAAGDYLVA